MGEIYLIRHGQASFGSQNYDRLSELGARQSRILANHFRSIGFIPDAFYSGPLQRHKATAHEFFEAYRSHQIVLPELEVLEGFTEYSAKGIIKASLGSDSNLLESIPKMFQDPDLFRKVFSSAMLSWVTGSLVSDGLETWDDLKKRVSLAMKTIQMRHGKGKTIGVITSGGAIAATLSNSLGLSGEDAMRLNWQIVNTSVTRYVFDHKKITLAGFNSTDHLKLEKDPSLITWW